MQLNSCEFCKVDSIFYGCITWGLHARNGRLFAHNNSFVQSTSIYPHYLNPQSSKNIYNNDAIFKWNSFTNLSASYGGAIRHRGTGNIEISNCSFVNNTATVDGGTLHLSGEGVHFIKDSYVENGTAPNSWCGGIASYSGSDHVYQQITFKNCHDNNGGGGFHIRTMNISDTITQIELIGCSSMGKNESGGGGGMLIGHDIEVHLSDCLFDSCVTSTQRGGGLAFTNLYSVVDGPFGNPSISFCVFRNNSAIDIEGQDMFVSTLWKGKLTKDRVKYCRSFSVKLTSLLCVEGEEDKSAWLNGFWNPFFVDGMNGVDREICGSTTKKCGSLGYAVQFLNPDSLNHNKVFVSNQTNEINIIVENRYIEIENENLQVDKVTKIICLIDADLPFIEINEGFISFTKIQISLANVTSENSKIVKIYGESGKCNFTKCIIESSLENDKYFKSELFSITQGTIYLSESEMKSFQLSDFPLFSDSDKVICNSCIFTSIKRRRGNGSVFDVTVMEGKTFLLRNYTFDRCECHEGNGGGVNAKLTGNGEMIVNSTTIFEGCHANNLYHSQSRGGGIMIQIESDTCELSIESEVSFSVSNLNEANFGKDVFVCCNSGILLKSKVNESSFGFFEYTSIPSDVLKLCGSEDGKGEEVIPLFVYFHTIVSKLTADGNGEVALDHIYCGFEKFGCATVDYCLNNRANSTIHEIEVASETSIKCEMKVVSFNVSVSGKEERTRVPVRDEGSINQNWMIECTKSFEMCDLAFVLNEDMNGRRSAFIHSSSTVTITSCSFSFENSPLTEEKIGYNILNIEGGNLTVDGFVMEKTVTMNKVSPIIITNGVKLDIKNSRVSGVTVEGGSGEGGCIGAAIKEGGSAVVDNCSISTTCTGGGGMKGGGMMISVEDRGSLEINSVTFTGCQVPTEGNLQKGRGMGGGMFVSLADTMGSFVLEGVTFSECNAWKGKKVFISGNDLSEVMSNEKLKEELSTSDKKSLDELCGWERKTTGENGYVIPLVVYLWDNWSEKGFVSKEKGGDFSGCGFSEAPCSSIDHLISLRYEPLGKGESQISIGDSGLLSHPISFLSSLPTSPDSDDPAVVIKGTKKGTSVTITDEDGNAVSSGAMISSNVSLSFFNLSFIKPNITTQREIFIESSGTNTVLFVSNCSFGSLVGLAESFECYLIKVNGGSAAVQSCTLNKINELKGFIAFSPSTSQVTIQNVNISSATLKENSLISMTEEENQMNGNENTHLNGNKPVLKVVYCSFETIKNEGSSASVIELGSFDYAMECTIEDCTMSTCRSDLNTEGGGMKVVLKSEESVLKVNGSTFSTCRCSMESGRGGGLFIDGADTNVVYDNESQIPSLNFRFVNTLFWMNEAFAGKDIFIKCHSIEHQINETLFLLNYNQESLSSNNSICGKDVENERDVDLIPLITYYYGLHVFLNGTGADGRRCGAQSSPCSSINCAVDHIQEGVMNAILIDGEGVVSGECVIGDLNVNSYKKSQAIVRLNCKIEKSAEKDCVMEFVNECSVERCSFQFEDGFESTHNFLMKVKNGSMEIQKCEFFSFPTTTAEALKLNSSIVNVESGELKIFDSTFRDIHPTRSVLSFHEESDVTIVETRISNIKCEGDVVSVGGKAKVVMKIMAIENVSVASERCVVAMEDAEQEVSVLNCSFEKSANSVEKGSMMQIRRSKEVKVEICVFDGEKEEKEAEAVNGEQERVEKLCKWSGSLIDIENSNVEMKETTIRNSKVGGLWVSGGSVKIEKGEFVNNNPVIEGYPSLRRNIICSDSGTLNVMSLKGGDGLERNTSLWMLNDGCNFEGIVSERDSSFFIPVLESVETKEEADRMKLTFKGMLLVPCNLSFSVVKKKGDEKEIEKHDFDSNGFLSEREVEGSATKDLISTCGNETEVSVCIVFGNAESPSSTNSFILKNKSETEPKGDDRIVEGGKEGKSYWMLIVIIMAIILMIVLIVSVVLAVRWRKQKRRTEELEEIVNDNIRKDPKAFEMVTMEMSPEEQWRRAEREAEKKNEERIKKRVYEKSLGHSESSEHLLSESGSTEYILGRDSDKIPEWMLEKVDEKEEEEETRKRTPSPSISSTSTTDTSDTDTTFVRMEDACPTTSSMSNLVDAMACSSPHEKLIVDLRDSLFMLLHGQNKTKEMAIGTLQEREITAAQILFWVVNLALHSFDEMENPLQSLANLSPHIILFSEHMVICIATHSDCSSSDSDSSSISSSTIVTSSSDCSRRSKRFTNSPPPSSAFEDDDLRKECMRWKAPELLMNKKMGATKKSVVFSIGMMLWECLTLQIPFGEYEAEVAGQKIERGERPCSQVIIQSSFCGVIENCMNSISQMRPALFDLKKELFQHFPPGVMVVTASDAIDIANNLECSGRNNTSKIDPSQSW